MLEDCDICKAPFDKYQHEAIILCSQQHICCEYCSNQLLQQESPKCPECRQNLNKSQVHKFRQYLDWLKESKELKKRLNEQQVKAASFSQISEGYREIMKYYFPKKDQFYKHIKQSAESLFEEGKNYAAISLLEALIQRFPNQRGYNFIGLGSKQEQTGFSQGKPLSWYKKKNDVQHLSSQDLLNHILLQTPEYKGNIEWYRQMTIKHPKNYKVFYGSALSKHKQNMNQFALIDYKKVRSLNYKFTKAQSMMAFIEQDSLLYARICLMQDKQNIFAKYILACNEKQNRIQKLSEIVAQEPTYVRALNQIGEQLCKQKLYDQAIEKYTKCIQINPLYFQPKINLSNAYLSQAKYKQAILHSKQLLSQKLTIQQRSQVLRLLGSAHSLNQETYQSITYLKQSIEINLLDNLALINLGKIYNNMKKYQIALKLFKEVHVRDEKNLSAIEGITNCYITLAKPIEAVTYCKKWIQLEPRNSSVKFYVANAYFRLKDWHSSIEYFLMCKAESYKLGEVYSKLIESYNNLKDYKNALKYVGENLQQTQLSQEQYDKVIAIANKINRAQKQKQAEEY